MEEYYQSIYWPAQVYSNFGEDFEQESVDDFLEERIHWGHHECGNNKGEVQIVVQPISVQ